MLQLKFGFSVATFSLALTLALFSTGSQALSEPASNSLPVESTVALTLHPAMLDANQSKLEQYLIRMRAPVANYLKVMVDLVPLVEPPYDDANKMLEADHPEVLADSIGKVVPPAAVSESHTQLLESLRAVEIFLKNGGLPKVGFSKALAIAQRMREVSDQYHAEILKDIEASRLPKSDDPFLLRQTKSNAPDAGASSNNLSVITKGSYGAVEKSGHGRIGMEASRDAASANFDLKDSHYDRGSMINGVGGSMGMSGLVNGLGGTGTNGLVDGLGFSSGLNGYANGAGVSTGTSGYMNDMNVMSPSSGSRPGF